MKTILMKFQGPLQSYGTDSHFERRHTDDHPSKGAVLGLVAAALGIRREETDRLRKLKDLRMIVRVDQIGMISTDYQIAAKYKKTYVTYREYIEDAVFLVALEGENCLMESVYEALQKPYFQLFYGRRSCPVNYDFLLGIYEEAAFEKIREMPWMAADWYQKRRAKQEKIRLDVYGAVEAMPLGRQKELRRDQPVSFSQLGRQHDLRFERHENIWLNNPSYTKEDLPTEHDAFAALMEE